MLWAYDAELGRVWIDVRMLPELLRVPTRAPLLPMSTSRRPGTCVGYIIRSCAIFLGILANVLAVRVSR